jgi:hypothetical protein
MVIDFTTQTAPVLWALVALLLLLALVIFACVDPESAEVFFGDLQLLVATVTLAAVAIIVLSGRIKIAREIGPPVNTAGSHADARSP